MEEKDNTQNSKSNKKWVLLTISIALMLFITLAAAGAGIYHSSGGYDHVTGEILNNTADIYAFTCSRSYGNVKSEGGSYITTYRAVIRDGQIHVFNTFLGTTADSGSTIEYTADISTSDTEKIKKHEWKYRYLYCQNVATQGNTYTILTQGMNDTESRNQDGSYKWEDYFNELAGLK